jgi:hypothetical protein
MIVVLGGWCFIVQTFWEHDLYTPDAREQLLRSLANMT